MTDGAHVSIDPCLLVDGCDWSGMHWHWGARRFRTLRELTDSERMEFDRVLRKDQTTAPAGRRQPPERSTMPNRSEITGSGRQVDRTTYSADASSMGEAVPQMSAEEATDRERLADVSQWLGLLDVPRDVLRERVASRPLGVTTDDVRQLRSLERYLGTLTSRVFELRDGLRTAISQHLTEHDQRAAEDDAKADAADPRR